MKTKNVKTLIGVTLLSFFISGCSSLTQPEYDRVQYRYYVIDAHADVPDADFSTFKEASVYQKDFAEHHDYVIVKINKRYNVYNMEIINED
jgi:PBP1b-binding outer membrane lipoprotein LpoB